MNPSDVTMDSFYDSLSSKLTELKVSLNEPKRLFQHNHQPVRFIVNDCLYCKLYGNCLNDDLRSIGTSQETITNSIHHKVFD